MRLVTRAPRHAAAGSEPSGEFHPLNLPLSQALMSGANPEIKVRSWQGITPPRLRRLPSTPSRAPLPPR
uniref:Uncharacterized protein n=1 Tax=Siphoviridae sp. ctQU013 TaxID=2826329 RepID=A0A8S5NN37_9CAUD|nr:MAG TPA: hypothetical protein [Siphoviridae sp. ctQU013]